MATNEFLVFADEDDSNVMSQADYLALEARLSGFVTGKAVSEQLNKVWRQSAAMAAMLGQLIAGAGFDALDDGDAATLLANFKKSLAQQAAVPTIITATGAVALGTSNVIIRSPAAAAVALTLPVAPASFYCRFQEGLGLATPISFVGTVNGMVNPALIQNAYGACDIIWDPVGAAYLARYGV